MTTSLLRPIRKTIYRPLFMSSLIGRLILSFTGIALLVMLVGSISIWLSLRSLEAEAVRAAELSARMIALAIARDDESKPVPMLFQDQQSLQDLVEDLYRIEEREIEIIDRNRRIIADVIPQHVGDLLPGDVNDEVGQTLKDGVIRTFLEIREDHPQGVRILVVPLRREHTGEIIGALLFEYTPLYNNLLLFKENYIKTIWMAIVICGVLAAFIGYQASKSITVPLMKLREAAMQIKDGDLDIKIDLNQEDEIGELASAFRAMSVTLKETIQALQIEVLQRKEAEEAIHQSETRFRGLFEYAPISLWEEDFSAVHHYIDDLRGAGVVDFSAHFAAHPEDVIESSKRVKIVDVNRATLELYQAENKAQLLADLSKVLGPDSLTPFKEELLALVHGEMVFETEIINYTLGGEMRVVQLWLTIAPGYEQTWAKAYVGISDITARSQVEEALRQSEERYKLMAWATKDAVWDWDLQTNQVWWGEGLQKIFHYSSEMTHTNLEWWFEHIHPEDRAKVDRTIDQALTLGMEFWSKEYRFQRKDGTYADIMDRGYILRDGTGKPYRMIGAMMDMTERKYMESSLLQANEQMRQFLNELQRRNQEIALLNEMSHLLQACQTEQEAYIIIGDLAKQLFPRSVGAMYMINPARTLASAVASWGNPPSLQRVFALYDCWALRRGQTHSLSEDQNKLRCLHLSEPLPVVSYCVPMQAQGEILGILHVQAEQEENLDEAKRHLAHTVVEQITMALSNLNLREALREQSIRDPLTGLYNRRSMEEVLKQQVSRATRQLHPLGIVMIDIDHFKRFNDSSGHAAGDMLLRELGQFLKSQIRGEDIACRYGGEEFTLILPDATQEMAQRRAEELQEKVRRLQLKDGGQFHETITLSMGVAIYPQHGPTIETVLHAADQALYRAKREGRDRVMIAE